MAIYLTEMSCCPDHFSYHDLTPKAVLCQNTLTIMCTMQRQAWSELGCSPRGKEGCSAYLQCRFCTGMGQADIAQCQVCWANIAPACPDTARSACGERLTESANSCNIANKHHDCSTTNDWISMMPQPFALVTNHKSPAKLAYCIGLDICFCL